MTREEAIEHLKNIAIYSIQDGYTDEARKALDMAIKALEEPHWIPCSERLPEESGRYLATRGLKTTGPLWNRVYIVNYSDLMGLKSERIWWDGNVGKSDFRRLEDVIAWTPLPEPYRKGEPMNDLISRQAAIDAVNKNTFRLTFAEEQNCEGHVAWSAEAVYSDVMEGALLELPSAQPEIIQCKDCKWKQGAECVRFADVRPFADDFCSRAERREE